MASKKPHLNLVVVGHVDHGKSTLFGRVLYEIGALDERRIEELKKIAAEFGKESFFWAYALDRLKEERKRGLTIQAGYAEFETSKYYYTLIDCPGHRDFIKNMITGASQADCAVLVVSAKPGEFEAGFGEGGQTREHAQLVRIFGIKRLVVAVNKMDTVNYDEKRFKEIKEKLSQFLKMIGYKEGDYIFVPVSAWEGQNVTKPSEKMPWYKGPTLVEAMDSLFEPPEPPINLPLRVPIQDVYSIRGVGTVPVGRVMTGVLKVGDRIIINPPGKVGEVRSIEMHHKPLEQAIPGDNIGFNVKGIGKDDVKRGDVVGHPDNPPTVAKEFIAQVVILRHPTSIGVGYTPVFHIHTATVACRFEELQKKLDPRTGQVIEENPKMLKTGDIAVVKIVPTRPVVIEEKSKIPQLSTFAIRDMGITVGAGVAIKVTPREG